MKKIKKVLLYLVFVLVIFLFTACAKGHTTIKFDESGFASWQPVEGAVAYEYIFADHNNRGYGDYATTTETSIQIPEGYRLDVRAVYENGEKGKWINSDYYGEAQQDGSAELNQENFENTGAFVHSNFTVKIEDLKTYNLIASIDYDTVKQAEDGGVSFVAAAPNGDEMRFVGTAGITVESGGITFEPGSSIMALDSIGRICMYKPVVSDPGQQEHWFHFTGGYTFDGTTSVDTRDELFEIWPISIIVKDYYNNESSWAFPMIDYQPNMIGIGSAENAAITDSFTLSELIVYYDEATYATPIKEMTLDTEAYGTYLEGDFYDAAKEVFDPENEIYDFHLLVRPLLSDEREPEGYNIDTDYGYYLSHSIQNIDMSRITIGELKDADGNVIDKATEELRCGSTLEISLDGGEVFDMTLPVIEEYKGAQTLHELVPYKNTFSKGAVNVLVIPLMWQDYPELADDALLGEIQTALGRVIEKDGSITDYSGSEENRYSLSSYYDTVSNGNYHIDSFITDWCPMNYNFEEIKDNEVLYGEWKDEAFLWVKENYADNDWSRFDANQDGILDAVIFVGANPEMDSYFMTSFGGATHNSPSYIPANMAENQEPVLKEYIYIGSNIFENGSTLIHEYGHNFGLIDYYDVSYKGVDAVGSFDMQSRDVGDWNAYSKYSVGWIEPHIVQNLAAGESVELTIGAQSDTGDAIVIPAVGAEFDGPFNEYILVDLFTDSGVNRFGAKMYGLSDTTGVRIYHVNARMERRVLEDIYGTEYPIGTVRYANVYSDEGKYHLELLQKGGDNTFTDTDNLRTLLAPQDLFYAGDSFDAVHYDEFLTNGKMDNGDEFGYIIKVVDITETDGKPVATIRITRK